MKAISVKDRIKDLLTLKTSKKYMLVARKKEPGVYLFEGKKYNESEFSELVKNYEHCIVLVHGNCLELCSNPSVLNVEADSPKTEETLLKLRNIKR